MGFLKRITGVATQVRANQQNAAALTAAAKANSEAATNAAIDQARTIAEQQAASTARDAAIARAKELSSTPMDSADVQLEATSSESAAAATRKKRGQFGRDYMSGVSI
jgi:hypothetical protein